MTQPLFILGNKRSGTSHLTLLLNTHPKIFVAPEADLVWALYRRSRGQPIERYPMDGSSGLAQTIGLCGAELSDPVASANEIFWRILSKLARASGKILDDLEWAGDKKPVQHADPPIFDFIRTTWPKARFVHIVRHPAAVIASKKAALAGHLSSMTPWDRPDDELLAFWTENERRVLAHKAAGAPIFSIALPALIRDPVAVLRALFDFLDLPGDANVNRTAQSITVEQDMKYDLNALALTPEAKAVVDLYDLG